MKRLILLLLSLFLLIGSLGCGSNEENLKKPAKFYYLNKEVDYGVEDGLISYELQETEDIGNDLLKLLTQYKQGPISHHLINVLSPDINITSVEKQGSVITVSTDTSFAHISGIDRTIACSCISMTLLDYTGAEYIEIHIIDEFLGEKESLIFSRQDMYLLDINSIPTENNTQ